MRRQKGAKKYLARTSEHAEADEKAVKHLAASHAGTHLGWPLIGRLDSLNLLTTRGSDVTATVRSADALPILIGWQSC